MPSLGTILIVIITCVVLGFSGGFAVEYYIKNDQIEAQALANAKALQQAQNNLIAIERKWANQFNQQEATHNDKITSITTEYNGIISKLRAETTAANSLPKTAATASKCNGGTTRNGLPWKNIQTIIDLARTADNQAQQLIECQGDLRDLTSGN